MKSLRQVWAAAQRTHARSASKQESERSRRRQLRFRYTPIGFSVDSNRLRAALGPRGVGGIRISPLNSPWNPITPLKPPRPHGPGPGAVLLFACSSVGQYVFDAFLILSKRTGISIVAFGSAEIPVDVCFTYGVTLGYRPNPSGDFIPRPHIRFALYKERMVLCRSP